MHLNPLPLSLSLLSIPLAVYAASHDIAVGKGGLKYDPESLTAAKGDTLVFHFYPDEHNVVQGSFDKPCEPSQGGIFSGDVEVENGVSDMVFTVTVNNTDPIWIYCSEARHCPSGMAMVVNPPKDQSLDAYKKAAEGTNPSSPSAIAGGMMVKAADIASMSSGSSSGTSSPSASPTSGSSTSTGVGPTISAQGGARAGGGSGGGESGAAPAPAATTGAASGLRVQYGGLVGMVGFGVGGWFLKGLV